MSVNVVDNNVTVTASQEVEVANELVTNAITNEYPNTITVKSNEFAIVGDGLFATTKEEVPGWMRELVDDLARSATAGAYNAMTGFNYNLYNAMIALQVAENKYQQAINTRVTDQEAFVQAVETLNSTVQNAEAEIVGIKQTYATKDFSVTTATQTLEASLNGGAIKSSLGQLASTMTNQYGTMAQRMDVLESTFEDLELGVEGYANATNTLETYVGLTEGVPDGTGLLAKVDILERQNDGVIETVTGTYDVILRAAEPDFSELVTTAEPYASWLAADTVAGGITNRLAHIGDVYVKYQDTASGAKEYVASYKFIRTVVDTTTPHSTDSEGFTWAVIVDQAAEMAYEAAMNAYDLADGKRRVFTATPVGPYDVGDLWVRVVGTSNQIWRASTASTVYNVAHWQVASTDDAAVVDFVDNVYTPAVTNLQQQVDGKIESWYTASSSDPKAAWTTTEERTKHDGDLWYQVDTKNSYYYSSGTHSWNTIEDSTAIAALEAAGEAQATADGVVVSYYAVEQSTAPATSKLWLNDAKLLQKFNSDPLVNTWEAVPVKIGDTLTTVVTQTGAANLGDSKVYIRQDSGWVTETAAGVVASSKAVTDLNLQLTSPTGALANAVSTLENSLIGTMPYDGVSPRVDAKFKYNSTININGGYYNSGFGLETTTDPITGLPTSEFLINADKFKMTTTGYNGAKYNPFSVDGTTGEITFKGKVSFSSVTGTSHLAAITDIPTSISELTNDLGYVVPSEVAAAINNNTTTIDGSKITTGTIQAGAIAAGAITADKISSNAIDGRYITGGTIEGAFIKGANIVGAVIKSSWLDFSGSGYLTDWKSLTPANVPAAYINNFAKNNDGSLAADSEGFARLPTTGTIGDVHVPSTTISRARDKGPNGETDTLFAIAVYPVAYDDYTTSNANRFLRERITVGGGDLLIAALSSGYGSYDYVTLNTTIKVGYYAYQIYAAIDNSDRWSLTVSSAYSNTNSFSNYGNIVNWGGTGNVDTSTYTDPNNCFRIAAQSYGDGIVTTLDIVVSMPPGFIDHSRLSGPLVLIDTTTLYRSDNDPAFTVTRGIPKISYASGLLQTN